MPRKPVNVDVLIDRHAHPQLYRNTVTQRKTTIFSKLLELSLMTGMEFVLYTRSIDEKGNYQKDVASSSKPENFAADALSIFVPGILERARDPGPPHREVIDRIRRAKNRDRAHLPNPTIIEEKPSDVNDVLLGVLDRLKTIQGSQASADCSDTGTDRSFVASLDHTMDSIRKSIEETPGTTATTSRASQPNFTNYLYADKEVYHAHWPKKNVEPTLYSPLSQGVHFTPEEALAVADAPEDVLKKKRRTRKTRKKTSLT